MMSSRKETNSAMPPVTTRANDVDATTGDQLMALLERPAADSRELYFEWERGQWEAGAIDLVADAQEWPGLSAPFQTTVLSLLGCWYRDGSRMQELTVALADGVLTEQDQVFMTAQLADAARHSVAFDRYFA